MFEINRSSLVLFGLEIRWYGVLIALGVLGAVLLALKREKQLGLKKDTTLNLALICVPVGVICARLYYVIFSWDYYSAHPGEILNLRSGGLAIYGAVIGGALAALIYAKVGKTSFASIADLIAPGLAFGQAVGRWGNFLNQEAYGALVENPALHFFPVSVYIEGSGWHWATFFYESIWCAMICAALLILEGKGKFRKRGDVFLSYAFLYALERCVVEGLRSDSLYLGPFRVSQLLSFAALIVLAVLLAFRGKHRPLLQRLLPVCFAVMLLFQWNILLSILLAAAALFAAAKLYFEIIDPEM
ncbi:MAG: prolipoprotein diacylglyceryl transferase [Clostridia bacterium]|nr:prolipoprotein diacylglyceryl transferase [Clostridia bacterium]